MRFAGLLLLTACGDDVALGRRIFQTGERLDGSPVQACLGEPCVPIAGAAARCAGCHGPRANGTAAGAVLVPPIHARALGEAARDGFGKPRRPRYDDATLRSAITTGHSSGGHRLHWAMPRFALTPDEVEALSQYLSRIEAEPEPGVDAEHLRVALVMPPGVERLTTALVQELERADARGGYFGRRLVLGAPPEDAVVAITYSEHEAAALTLPHLAVRASTGDIAPTDEDVRRLVSRLDRALRRTGAKLTRESLQQSLEQNF